MFFPKDSCKPLPANLSIVGASGEGHDSSSIVYLLEDKSKKKQLLEVAVLLAKNKH